jgi:hypothetical protein
MFNSSDWRVKVMSRGGPAVDGLCGSLLKELQSKGEQGAQWLLSVMAGNSRMIGGRFGGGGVMPWWNPSWRTAGT